jgi:hypothetical protein
LLRTVKIKRAEMKKTRRGLAKVQEETIARRHLLESGKVRLIPRGPKPPVHQKDTRQEPEKPESK